MQTNVPERNQHRVSHGNRQGHLPDSGPLPDTARTISMLAGGAAFGAVVGGPVGAIVGGIAGVALGLGATGHLPERS
jgi:hypothetical protein